MNMVQWQGNLLRLVGTLAALVLACPIAGAQGSGGAPFAVWAIGLPDGYIVMEHQETVLRITEADVARGMVEIRGGSRFTVTAQAPARYAVKLFHRGSPFRGVSIEGLDGVMELGGTGTTLAYQDVTAGRRSFSLDYRFTLAPDTAPGTYAWPLELVARRDPQAR